jgi:hypothetical protein
MIKNLAGQKIGAEIVSAGDGSAFNDDVLVYVTKDGGTQIQGTESSGYATNVGNGYFVYAPSALETNGDLLAFTFVGVGAVPVTVQVYPVDSVVTALFAATGIDSVFTYKQLHRIIAAAVAGKPVGVGTNTITFRNLGDTKDVITGTVDELGNVLTLSFDVSD